MDKQSFMIGVDRLFLAEITSDAGDGAATVYGTPFLVPGVTQIAITRNSANVNMYADDGAYESVQQNGDLDVACSLAGLTGEKRADVIGADYNSSTGVVDDDNIGTPKQYALGYRKQKVTGAYRYKWFMKGSFTKPDSTSDTKGATITPQPMQYMYRALNRASDQKMERTLDSDDANIPTGLDNDALNNATTGWFSDPDYVPVAPGTPISDLVASTGTGPSGSIALAFSAPTGATSVKAQVEQLDGTWTDVSTTAAITAASTSAEIIGLTGGNTYNCRLVVVGGGSNGISNEDTAAAVV